MARLEDLTRGAAMRGILPNGIVTVLYGLCQICERGGWAQEALPYNGLVVARSEVGRLAGEVRQETPVQGKLF